MASNSSIDLVGLDFDTIKSNLKTYLKSQTEFSDYDFEGSNLNVLIDLLAYNTFHMGFYLNMVASESFLDSAQMRNSVVSHAKELNYVPRSSRSAKATVSLTFDADTNVVTIPKGASFTTTVGYNLFTFITDHESVHFSGNGSFVISELDIYEGQLSSDRFIVNYEDTTQRFLIVDPKIDTRSITVSVTDAGSTEAVEYSPVSSTLGLDSDDTIFFLQAAEDGKYEIIFGDGILGKRPKDNSIVTIEYRVCNEDAANGASRFELDTAFAAFTSTPAITVDSIAIGGSAPESIASIKFYAPRHFQTQERAINTNDYEIILSQRFGEINAISAYGGETLNPPQYGKVFIAVDISDVDGLPSTKVSEYTSFIAPRAPLSIDVVFVEPDYLYYEVVSNVKFSVNETSFNSDQIKSLIVNRIVTYNETYLDDFKATFRNSKFVRQIDDTEGAAIISNDTNIRVYKRIVPTYGESYNLDVAFNMPLTKSGGVLGGVYDADDMTAVDSTEFTSNGELVKIQDDGDGTLRLVQKIGDTNVVVSSDVGTIDYVTGLLQINNLTIDSLETGERYLRVFANPKFKDFETKENVILTLEADRIDITMVPVRESTSIIQTRQRA